MNQLKKILFLLSVSCMNVLSADAIEFSYGTETFAEKARLYRYHSITFSETPSYAVKATECGQGDGLSTYWDYMLIKDIVIKKVNCNSNKPGFRRLSDVGHEYTYNFYDASRAGNFLIPGLGSRRYSNDDGIYIGFTRVGRPVTSIGFIWGSVQTPSECCIRQWFDFSFTDGTTETVRVDFTNDYIGNGTESSSNTFLSFYSKNKPISSIKINQLGHNPILDEIRIGGLKGDRHIIIDIRDFNATVKDPARDIIVKNTINNQSAEELALQNLKQHKCDHAQKNKRISDSYQNISESMRTSPFFGYYADRISEATLGNFFILNKLCKDPPRFDHDQVTEFDPVELENTFQDEFGEDFILFDNLFRTFDSNIELLEDSLVTLERLQGAYLDGNKEAFDIQAAHLGELWSDSDLSMQTLSSLLEEINDFFYSNSYFDLNDASINSFVETTKQLNSELSTQLSSSVYRPKSFPWPIILQEIMNNPE